MFTLKARPFACLRSTSVGATLLKSVKTEKASKKSFLVSIPFEGISTPTACLSVVKRNFASGAAETMSADDYKSASSIYDFTVQDSFGQDVKLDKYKGHPVLIVNIASRCGLTKNNYQKITELKEKYYDKGLRILSFPCNQFGGQMPEENGEEMVCHLRDSKADVGDVFQKINVNGNDAHPLYKYLKHKQGGTLGDAIKWNFTKFLVDKNGQPIKRYSPTTDPMDIAKDIENNL